MVQDQIIFCVGKNVSLPYMLDLGFAEFDSLYGSCLRNHASEVVDNAWIRMIAAQGKHKDLEKWVERWRKLMETKPRNDLKAFLRDFGKGM